MARIIRTARNALIPLFLLLVSGTSAFAQHTYYISKSAGSDSNTSTQAQSKTTPWAHLPGMASCTLNCASYTPVAGDIFIQKGCDTWGNSDLPVEWDWSGSSGSPITVTVDKTWYNTSTCASAWNRPVWDAGKIVAGALAASNYFFYAGISGTSSNGVLDSIEMKGLACVGPCNNKTGYITCWEGCTNWTFSNHYLHGWNVVTDGTCDLVSVGGAGTLVTSSVIDGSDATGASPAGATCYAFYPGLPAVTNNVIHDVANGIVGYGTVGTNLIISGNQIYNINLSNSGSHPNAIETLADLPRTEIFDNVIYNVNPPGAVVLLVDGNSDIYNNTIFVGPTGNSGQPSITIDTGSTGPTLSANVYNNTLQVSGSNPIRVNARGYSLGSLTVKNNHFIDSTGSTATDGTGAVCYNQASSCDPVGTYVESNNADMTNAAATSAGYTSSQTYAFSPTSLSRATVGAGANLTSSCRTFTSLCSETNYASSLQTISGVIQSVSPARTAVTRPSSAAWDVGAFQYAGAQASAPNPPTGLMVIVQ